MNNNENGFLFYFLIGVIYAVVLGILLAIFNIFTDDKTPLVSIIFQSVFFGIFMSLFDYWQIKRKNKKK